VVRISNCVSDDKIGLIYILDFLFKPGEPGLMAEGAKSMSDMSRSMYSKIRKDKKPNAAAK